MAEFKRKTLFLKSGKQIRLYGSSFSISKELEIGEGYAPTVLSHLAATEGEKNQSQVNNPHRLSPEDVQELADYNIRLWLELKENVRKHGLENRKIFSGESGR